MLADDLEEIKADAALQPLEDNNRESRVGDSNRESDACCAVIEEASSCLVTISW